MEQMIKAVFFDLKEAINDLEHLILEMCSKIEKIYSTSDKEEPSDKQL